MGTSDLDRAVDMARSTMVVLRAERDEARAENAALRERAERLAGLLREAVAKGEAMKEAFFTGDDTREAIACMEWDDVVVAAELARG